MFRLPPEDHIKLKIPERPWETDYAKESYRRSETRKHKHWSGKFFRINYADFEPQKPEDWTIFPGDLVQVMIGRDKGKQGMVNHVIRDYNAVFVDGLHMVGSTLMIPIHTWFQDLESQDSPYLQSKGLPNSYVYVMQPLDPTKNQVKLVDPNDKYVGASAFNPGLFQ